MKKILMLLGAACVLSACSLPKLFATKNEAQSAKPVQTTGNVVARTAYVAPAPQLQSGVSSATVENLAKKIGCRGAQGAQLISEKGPVEYYRISCENGQVFQAKCELRQCQQT